MGWRFSARFIITGLALRGLRSRRHDLDTPALRKHQRESVPEKTRRYQVAPTKQGWGRRGSNALIPRRTREKDRTRGRVPNSNPIAPEIGLALEYNVPRKRLRVMPKGPKQPPQRSWYTRQYKGHVRYR